MLQTRHVLATAVLALLFVSSNPSTCHAQQAPIFSLAWSEYPSWSVFGVASELGIIDGARGKLGALEKKHGVDIELKLAEYDVCIQMYGAATCDAACVTNMDALSPSLGRPSISILPTSTSNGADALIVTGIQSIQQLQGKPVYGLSKSVSEYCFSRNLELLGEREENYRFVNRDPATAALAMQQKQPGANAIVVWNPFLLSTLQARPDATVLFDSSTLPNEIIDMVVVAESSLARPGGDRFALCVIEAFYAVTARMAHPSTRDDTLIAIGEKFSNLGLNAMAKVVQQTAFYETPAKALSLFEGDVLPDVMDRVSNFCVSHGVVDKAPAIQYGPRTANPATTGLRFDPTYIRQVANSQQ